MNYICLSLGFKITALGSIDSFQYSDVYNLSSLSSSSSFFNHFKVN